MNNFKVRNNLPKGLAIITSTIFLLFFSLNNALADQRMSHGESQLITSMVFAESSATTSKTLLTESVEPMTPEFKERWFTANKFHQYLGLSSLALATATALVPKPDKNDEDYDDGAHATLARSAAILGGAAVVSGLAFHYKDLTWKGLVKNPDNLHALLGTLGTIGYLAAINDAPGGNHPTYGIAGAVSMLAAIKITW